MADAKSKLNVLFFMFSNLLFLFSFFFFKQLRGKAKEKTVTVLKGVCCYVCLKNNKGFYDVILNILRKISIDFIGKF